MNKKINPFTRHRARRFLIQAIYQWQLSGQAIADIEMQFLVDEVNFKKVDVDYFRELIHAIPQQIKFLDELITPWLDRPLDTVDPIELAILRLGAYELKQRLEIPYRVVLNEALELAKVYSSEDSYKYINSILDRVAHQTRTTELDAEKKS